MKTGRLCIRVDPALLEDVKHLTVRKGITITLLIEQYFRCVVAEEKARTDEFGVQQA
jgi:hypothetical protein